VLDCLQVLDDTKLAWWEPPHVSLPVTLDRFTFDYRQEMVYKLWLADVQRRTLPLWESPSALKLYSQMRLRPRLGLGEGLLTMSSLFQGWHPHHACVQVSALILDIGV
jgi:hypothetical protein